MPVHHGLREGNKPEWSKVTAAGIFKVARDGRFDLHYHDYHEYWLIYKGCAKVLTEGQAYIVRPGDIVCTKAGDEHDVLEVYEDLEAFYFEDKPIGQKRLGHLHHSPELAKGHPVPAADLSESESPDQ